jgi:UDP-N-acetyl-D-glucosamine dehydrogenase
MCSSTLGREVVGAPLSSLISTEEPATRGPRVNCKMADVVIVGQGYVGLPLAVQAVLAGHRVVGYDTNRDRISRLLGGDSYVEDVSDAQLAELLATGRYLPTDDENALVGFDFAIIAVPTPFNEGLPDLSFVEDAATLLGSYLQKGACVVLESTTYPGTTDGILRDALERESKLEAGVDFYLGYSPERIDPGNTKYGLTNTPKIVSGVNEESLRVIRSFYEAFVERTVVVSSPREAELAKLIENTFRHVNIALVNEMAVFAHDLGIDVRESIAAAATKPFGFMRFDPGPGVGGHCLPIDPSYLSWHVKRQLGMPFRFVELANDINEEMPKYIARRLMLAMNERCKPLKNARVLLLGLAYKENTGDARESPAVAVAKELVKLGCYVEAADSHVDERYTVPGVSRVDLEETCVASADAVVLLTAHDSFDYDHVLASANYILDTRGRLKGPNVEQL